MDGELRLDAQDPQKGLTTQVLAFTKSPHHNNLSRVYGKADPSRLLKFLSGTDFNWLNKALYFRTLLHMCKYVFMCVMIHLHQLNEARVMWEETLK